MPQRRLTHLVPSALAPSRLAVLAALALSAGVLPAVAATAHAAPASGSLRTVVAASVRPGPFRPPRTTFDPTAARARVTPTRYHAVDVDLGEVRSTLATAPSARSRSALTFRIPRPTGGTERFAVRRSTVMEAGLAAAHPELRTYLGRSLDHPGTTVALDTTPMGFHAAVRGPNGQGAWYVDPAYDQRGARLHLSYYGSQVATSTSRDFAEREAPAITRAMAARARTSGSRSARRTPPGGLVTQRVYRLALTTDPSYAKYFGTANVLAEKVTLMNRVDQIYNDDMAITMRLVNGTDKLNLDTVAKATGPDGPCGAHPCFDPPDAAGPGEDDDVPGQLDFCDIGTLGRNRTVLGQLIGASNYDIGHIGLGVNGGGVAFLGVVGQDYKGSGCTGLPQPRGDFFAVDYVAHEMGHQFAGNHTFNGNRYNCGFGNRNGPTSVEPGSGSSVMGYAGICRQDDLQPHSDPYFSQRSQSEVLHYTGRRIQKVAEVQTVSLLGFDSNGESITLSLPGSGVTPITLRRGSSYDAASIDAAVQALYGSPVLVAQWGYDPFNSPTLDPAPILKIDDTGFQVVFSDSADPSKPPARAADEPALVVTSSSPGVSAFVGETAKGGVADNDGSSTVRTTNHAPRVTAPPSRTIPLRTPFKLTGSGRDADGDDLVYLWEQNDIGAGVDTDSGTPLVRNQKVTGPLFRVFGTAADVDDKDTLVTPSPGENAAGSPTRTFPDLYQVLNGRTNARTGFCPRIKVYGPGNGDAPAVRSVVRNCFSEYLPTRSYLGRPGSKRPAMHFRLTARDGYPNGGGSSYSDVTLRISRSAGPFLVTSQATRQAFVRGGTKRLVTWDVNGTKPLAAQVGILLSVDGGKTFTRVLAANTANDGSQSVTFPKVRTSQARIMVVARGNYFFAVNQAPFKITRR